MTHQIQFDHETETDAVFACTICGAVVGFNKHGVGDPQGEPHSEFINDVWVLPVDAEQYFGDCT